MAEPRRDDLFRAVLFVIAGGIITYSQFGPPSAPSAGVATKSEAKSDETSSGDYRPIGDLIRQFAGLSTAEPADALADDDYSQVRTLKQQIAAHAGVADPLKHPPLDVDFVVGIVPDPVDSDARWMFDSQLDALQNAAAQADYNLDLFSFPDWDPYKDAAADPASRRGTLHEKVPAIVMFRGPETANAKALVVFLVYETATSGIHQQALRHALRFIDQWNGCTSAEPVRIFGPTFSGSMPTLREELLNFHSIGTSACSPLPEGTPAPVRAKATQPRFEIVTGAATARIANQQVFANYYSLISFRSAVLSDEHLLTELATFIRDRYGLLAPNVAVLAESNTAYGGSLGATIERAFPGAEILRFPLHISRVRQSATAPGAGRETQARAVLDDPVAPKDRIPSMTPRTTSMSVELTLDSLLETIRRRRFTAVGLLATDTRDKLFLAQRIAESIPGILLFTTEVDTLYLHPQFRDAMRGMIVASSYAPTSQALTVRATPPVAPSLLQFPSSIAQGTYNAIRTSIGPRGDVDLAGYSIVDVGDGTPPVWLSVVGANAIWPLTFRWTNSGYSNLRDRDPDMAPEHSPSRWSALMLIAVLVMTMLHVAAHLLLFRPPAGKPWIARARKAVASWLVWAPTQGRSYTRYLGVCHFVLLLCAAVLAVVWWTGVTDLRSPDIAAVIAAAACVVALTACLFDTTKLTGNNAPATRAPRRSGHRFVKRVAVTLAGLSLVMLVWYLVLLLSQASEQRALFFDRATHPISGVSPVIPLLFVLLSFYVWAMVQLRRLNRAPLQPVAMCVRRLAIGLRPNWPTTLQTLLDHPSSGLPAAATWGIGGAVLVAVALAALQHPVTIEPFAFTDAVLLAWMVGQLLLALSVAQALYLWHLLRTLLRALATHPMLPAYFRVPKHLLDDRLAPRQPGAADLAPLVDRRRTLARDLLPLLARPRPWQTSELSWLTRASLTTPVPFDEEAGGESHVWFLTRTWQQLSLDAHLLVLELGPFWMKAQSFERAQREWYQHAEEFLGVMVVLFVRETLSRLVNTLLFVLAALLLFVAAQAMFPVHPRQLLLAFTWIDALVIIIAAMWVFVGIERDAVLARVSDTGEGIHWDGVFWRKVATYGLLPLITLFAAQFPQIGSQIVRWLTPIQQSVP